MATNPSSFLSLSSPPPSGPQRSLDDADDKKNNAKKGRRHFPKTGSGVSSCLLSFVTLDKAPSSYSPYYSSFAVCTTVLGATTFIVALLLVELYLGPAPPLPLESFLSEDLAGSREALVISKLRVIARHRQSFFRTIYGYADENDPFSRDDGRVAGDAEPAPSAVVSTLYAGDGETHLLQKANPANDHLFAAPSDTSSSTPAELNLTILSSGAVTMPFLNPIDGPFYFDITRGVIPTRLRQELVARSPTSGTRELDVTKTPFAIPPSLLYNDPFLDDPKAAWNQPECFYLRVRAETTYTMDTSYDGSDDGPPEGILDNDHYDFYPWYAEAQDWLTTRGPPPEVGLRCAVPHSILHELYALHGDGNLTAIVDGNAHSASCLTSLAFGNNCNPYRESLASCVVRQGYDRLESILMKRCREGDYWRATVPKMIKSADGQNPNTRLLPPLLTTSSSSTGTETRIESRPPQTPLTIAHNDRAQVCPMTLPRATASRGASTEVDAGDNNSTRVLPPPPPPQHRLLENSHYSDAYVEPSQRQLPDFGPPRICQAPFSKAKHYPISFGTSRRNFRARFSPKIWDFHPVYLDGNRQLLVHDEELYDALGAMSYFGYTIGRAGWECYRHHQQLAVGVVPYYVDLLGKPAKVQSNFPVEMLREVLENEALSHVGHVAGARPVHIAHNNYSEKLYGFNVKPRIAMKETNKKVRSGRGITPPRRPLLYSANDKMPLAVPPIVQSHRDRLLAAEADYWKTHAQSPAKFGGERVGALKKEMDGLPLETPYLLLKPSQWFAARDQVAFRQPMGSINHAVFDKDWYWSVARRMKRYSYANMSAESVASYVLKTMGAENAKSVLLIGNGMNDFTHLTLELGLDGLGIRTTVVDDPSHPSRECTPVRRRTKKLMKMKSQPMERESKEGGAPSSDYHLTAVTSSSVEKARTDRAGHIKVHGMLYSNLFRKVGRERSRYVDGLSTIMKEVRDYPAKAQRGEANASDAPPPPPRDIPSASGHALTSAPLYDAVIYTYFMMAPPVPEIKAKDLRDLLAISDGKVAVLNGSDSWFEYWPSLTISQKVFYFSREVRHDHCVAPPAPNYRDQFSAV